MTYTGGEFSEQMLFRELVKMAKNEHIDVFEAYADLIDSMIQDKISYGFFSEGEDLVQLRRDLELRWPELRDKLEL
jgi:hypothetical protein